MKKYFILLLNTIVRLVVGNLFVELGGGVGDALVWRCDGADVMLGCR